MSSDTPKISVLLPVWNAADTLPACLRSIARQTLADFECIIVDDGSTDGSLDLARSFAASDDRFRIVEAPHAGLVSSLNLGLQSCRGQLIARMDADDWMHRDRLRLQSDWLDRESSLDAVGSFVRIYPRRSMRDGRRAYEAWLHSLRDPETVWRDRFIECPVAHPTLMIRAEALARLPYRERGWPEDYDLMLRLLRVGPRIGIVPHRLVGWRDTPGRLSRNHADYALDRFTACRAWHLSRDFLGGHPRYVLWGHGRTGRALKRALAERGHTVDRIVDVHPRRIGERIDGTRVISPDMLSNHRSLKIIVSVAGAAPRAKIRAALAEMGFRDGHDFVAAA